MLYQKKCAATFWCQNLQGNRTPNATILVRRWTLLEKRYCQALSGYETHWESSYMSPQVFWTKFWCARKHPELYLWLYVAIRSVFSPNQVWFYIVCYGCFCAWTLWHFQVTSENAEIKEYKFTAKHFIWKDHKWNGIFSNPSKHTMDGGVPHHFLAPAFLRKTNLHSIVISTPRSKQSND